MISELANLPDISFIDNMTLTRLQAKMVSDFQSEYKRITKTEYALQRADPVSLCLYAAAVQIYQAMMYVDKAGKMDLKRQRERIDGALRRQPNDPVGDQIRKIEPMNEV